MVRSLLEETRLKQKITRVVPTALLLWFALAGCTSSEAEAPVLEQASATGQVEMQEPQREVAPLPSDLTFAFEEVAGKVTLTIVTETDDLPCGNIDIVTHLNQDEWKTLEIQIEGIALNNDDQLCLDTVDPAWTSHRLGELEGEYTLRFLYEEQEDRYRLQVSSDALVIDPLQTHITSPEYEMWKRLPPNTIWILAHSAGYDQDPTVFRERANRVFGDIEALGAESFVPEKGVYTNRHHIPPVNYLSNEEHRLLQIVRYYQYDGSFAAIEEILAAHVDPDAIRINAHHWNGERIIWSNLE